MKAVKQPKNRKFDWLKEYAWQKGQSGNPKGRPKEKTLKEYAREFLKNMSEEGRIAYFNGMKPEDVWKMAEGNPTDELKGDLSVSVSVSNSIAKKHGLNGSTGQNSG